MNLIELKKWFRGWLTILYKHRYHIVVYNCDDELVRVGNSKKQCIFPRNLSIKVNNQSITILPYSEEGYYV